MIVVVKTRTEMTSVWWAGAGLTYLLYGLAATEYPDPKRVAPTLLMAAAASCAAVMQKDKVLGAKLDAVMLPAALWLMEQRRRQEGER